MSAPGPDLVRSRLTTDQNALVDRVCALAWSQGGRAGLVGGAVRDALLGLRPGPLDLVVEGPAGKSAGGWFGIAVGRALADALGVRPVEHERFGTAVLRSPKGPEIDIATARRETYRAPAALPDVEACLIEDDLARRDFTLNAIVLVPRPDGTAALEAVPEAFGDLAARRLRVLHGESFRDDPTRLFRGVRLARRLGGSIESGTETLMRRAAERDAAGACVADRLTAARLRRELLLLFREQTIAAAESALSAGGLQTAVARGLAAIRGRPAAWDEMPGEPDPAGRLVRWIAAASSDPGAADAAARRLDLSAASGRRAAHLREALTRIVHLAEQRRGPEEWSLLHDAILSAPAGAPGIACGERPDLADTVRAASEEVRASTPALSPSDLIHLGLPEGPVIGRVLKLLRAGRRSGRIRSREDEEAAARRELLDSPRGAVETPSR